MAEPCTKVRSVARCAPLCARFSWLVLNDTAERCTKMWKGTAAARGGGHGAGARDMGLVIGPARPWRLHPPRVRGASCGRFTAGVAAGVAAGSRQDLRRGLRQVHGGMNRGPSRSGPLGSPCRCSGRLCAWVSHFFADWWLSRAQRRGPVRGARDRADGLSTDVRKGAPRAVARSQHRCMRRLTDEMRELLRATIGQPRRRGRLETPRRRSG
jgi:hypothetical protein